MTGDAMSWNLHWLAGAWIAARFIHVFVVAGLLVFLYRWLHRDDERGGRGGASGSR